MARKQYVSGAEQSTSHLKAEDNPGPREEKVHSPKSRSMRSRRNHVCQIHETTTAVVKPPRRACSRRDANYIASNSDCAWCVVSTRVPPLSRADSKATILARNSPISKDRASRRVGRGLSRVPRLRKPPKPISSEVDIFEIQTDSSSDERAVIRPSTLEESIDHKDDDSQGHERPPDHANSGTSAQPKSEQSSMRQSPLRSVGDATPVSWSTSASISEDLSLPELDYVFVDPVTDATLTCGKIDIFQLENPEKISLQRLDEMFERLEATYER